MNHNKFHETIDSLIALNAELRNEHRTTRLNLTSIDWAERYCTVRCDIGVRSGKTEYIRRHAKLGDLILVADDQSRHIYEYSPSDIRTAESVVKNGAPRRYNTVYVDEPAEVFDSVAIELVYTRLASVGEPTYVLLGKS